MTNLLTKEECKILYQLGKRNGFRFELFGDPFSANLRDDEWCVFSFVQGGWICGICEKMIAAPTESAKRNDLCVRHGRRHLEECGLESFL